MLNNRASKIGAFLLALFFVLTYLFPINDRLLWHPDETRYAEISREMVTQGDWVVPKLLDLRYFEKPVAGYWVNNVSQLVFGHTNFAVRAGSVFSILISTLLVYWMTLLMWRNRHTAFVASLVFVSMFLVFSVGTYSVLDPMFAMWVIASMAFSFRALKAENVKTRITSWCLLGLACGMGFMTKGFLALAIPVVAMLPLMAPLAVMIAKYGVDCVRKHRMKALQANGILNLTFGAVAVAGLIVASYLVKKPIYQPDEWSKVVLGIVAFTIWGIIGYLCYLLKAKHWLWAASCSLVISLTFGSAVPDRSVDSKLPQAFIRQNMTDLEKSPFIVSNSVGIGAGLAWELKRGDIYLLNNSGELTYGLKYPDSEYRLLNDATFADWLAEIRKKGQVALLVTDKNDTYDAKLPPADKRTENSRMTLYIYDKQP
ncbi:phospholipid carrier-dependent glycosyltransferase [Morganella morganii subsp. morganii]|nr:phospholipid carrier-dependent glycosyltransferase [Morganella morganii]MBT0347833.1 phospholipid carrier-dependent glycosyltransferase [Morganella morganii subsp. morganii]